MLDKLEQFWTYTYGNKEEAYIPRRVFPPKRYTILILTPQMLQNISILWKAHFEIFQAASIMKF